MRNSRLHPRGLGLITAFAMLGAQGAGSAQEPWSAAKAKSWYAAQPWMVGCNFSPSTAINQLEMWQADSFDAATIEKELGWAASLGFNTVRVYLHDLLWEQDAEGFLERMDQFLGLADAQGIRTMFVLFDAVWDPHPTLGTQRAPTPGVHNSGWLQSPHTDLLEDVSRHGELEGYVRGVIERFREDPRVVMWDLYNEPDNTNVLSYRKTESKNKYERAFSLLKSVFAWARDVNPTQPLTTAIWQGNWSSNEKMTELDIYSVEHSDIVSFHNYAPLPFTQKRVEWLQRFDRPLICTEYLARGANNTFEDILPYYKEQNIGAINWGLVDGKTQTKYPWGSWATPFTEEPELWHHEIFRKDGTPYRESEVALIRSLLKGN